MTQPTTSQIEMALRIANSFNLPLFSQAKVTAFGAALAAIIETQEVCAKLAEDGHYCRTCGAVFLCGVGHPIPECSYPNWDVLDTERIATAIRTGNHYGKDTEQ